jgi:dTMP kinase
MTVPTTDVARRSSKSEGGRLIAFEGLDQSGKQTQAERLAAACRGEGFEAELFSFPDYASPIGVEIDHVLHGGREFPPDVVQLLYIANRYEHRPRIESLLASGAIVICDRYLASSIAYGEAQGLDPVWLTETQRYLPQPSLTLLLDIAPDVSLGRKSAARDRYERDLALLDRVRASYLRQAASPDWVKIDGGQSRDIVTDHVLAAVRTRLGLPPAL